ncbi:hypothetical protein Ndes2437A_g03546 [Nannochloris sp. 'desiccata']
MAGSTSRNHWDVGKSAKKPRKEDIDEHLTSLPGSPARNGLVLPPQLATNGSGAQELHSHRLSIAQTAPIDDIIVSPPQQAANVTEAFNQLRVRTALERAADDDASPSISGAGHPPSPKKRKAAGSLQEDSSTQQRSGNDQQDINTAPPKDSEEELLQVFEQIQLNKDFYDAIARTESCAGEARQTSNNRANADRAAFQAAVNAAKAVLRDQVKNLAEQQGQEASPAFLQAYALHAIAIFATQTSEESYSGEDLEGEEGEYFTSSSVERPNSNSFQGISQPQEGDNNRNLVSKKRQQQVTPQQSGGGGGCDVDDSSGIAKEIAVIERSASAMVLRSPTTRSNATPTTTQDNRTPTASGILSENGNSSFLDPDLSDTAGMVDAIGDSELQGTPNRVLLRNVREGREAEGGIEQQQQQQQQWNEGGEGEAVLLPPQTPGEPSRPGHDEATDDEDDNDVDGEGNEKEGRHLGEEEEEQHAALVREMSVLEAVDADYDTGIDNEDQVDNLDNIGQVVIQEEEQGGSPPSRDENENREFFGAASTGTGAVSGGNGGDLLGQTLNTGGAFPGGVLHQDHHQIDHVPFPSAAAVADPHRASPIAVPQRPQAAAGHREKRDPRPSSSGGPSRLSNDPPKRQRKGPGFIVGSAPQDGGRGDFHGELFLRGPPPPGGAVPNSLPAAATAAATGTSSRLPQTPLPPAATGPLGDSLRPAVSQGSVGGGGDGRGNKQTKSCGKLYRKESEEEVDDSHGDDGGRTKKKKGEIQEGDNIINNPGAPTGAPELGGVGRRAWGSSLVCADLTVHDVASQYWPFLKKTAEGLATGKKAIASCGAGGGSKQDADGGTSSRTMSEGIQRELSSAEKVKVQELTAALETAILGTVLDEGPKAGGGRRLSAKVKSLAAVAAFDELWKEREQRLQEEENENEKQEGVVVAEKK